ncbi:hypothetical protein ACM7Z7_29795 [Pseudomonas aeruginosa]|nr:hypothetical protein [Pseudomonas aeruginosa]HDV4153079.1 hypothetical protein [Pseudomonas aeruginosa]
MSIQVTSTNGRTVNLKIESGSVVASSGPVKFMADKTEVASLCRKPETAASKLH